GTVTVGHDQRRCSHTPFNQTIPSKHFRRAALEALRLLAFGGVLDIDVLSRATSNDAVAAAHRSGHLRSGSDGARRVARLSHPIVGEVLREQTGALAARILRGTLARALAQGGAAGDRLQSAALALDSDVVLDPELLVAAAEQALALGDLPLAGRLAQSVMSRGGGLRVALAAARAQAWQGRGNEAAELLAAFDPEQMSEGELLAWGVWRSTFLFFAGNPVAARVELARLMGRPHSNERQDVVVATELTFDSCSNDVPRSIELTRRLTGAERCAPSALAVAAAAGGSALARAGHADEVAALAVRGRSAAEDSDFMIGHTQIGVAEVLAAVLSGNLAGIEGVLERYAPPGHFGRSGWSVYQYMRGQGYFAEGRLWEAADQYRRGLAAARAGGPQVWILLCSLGLCQALGAQGKTEQAAEALEVAQHAFGEQLASFEPDLVLARAWVVAARGEHRESVSLARKAAGLARSGSMFGIEVLALHTAVRFGDRSATGRLRRLGGQVDGIYGRTAAQHALCLQAGDGQGLDNAAREFETMGAVLVAADVSAQAASAHRVGGDRYRERLSASAAQRLAARCQGASTPALKTLGSRAYLTAREQVVASLIVAGMSNREIAERLTLSVRTVEGHIYRMFAKLDVDNRKELVDKLCRVA
ncbi:LuxR C-terminal-related transcriptional regulator, partial [Rhodococcus sp. NPDC058521]|uniref:LuxR C-terminal-related transcriptional regulator n=1 Tax=Rhodococcus sp. NPDC058521 TaxID=3346536 RepID=UPI0036696F47